MEGCKVKVPATTGEVQMMFLHGALTTALPGDRDTSEKQRAESRAVKKDAIAVSFMINRA